MERTQKADVVARMSALFQASPNVILAGFTALEVNKQSELRGKIAAAGGHYVVIKNRLARRAAAGTHVERIASGFVGPCALAVHAHDPIALARVLSGFAKDHPTFELKAAVIDRAAVIEGREISRLAELPGLPELRAQLLALILTPATMLVRLVATPAQQVARVLDARRGTLERPDDAATAGAEA